MDNDLEYTEFGGDDIWFGIFREELDASEGEDIFTSPNHMLELEDYLFAKLIIDGKQRMLNLYDTESSPYPTTIESEDQDEYVTPTTKLNDILDEEDLGFLKQEKYYPYEAIDVKHARENYHKQTPEERAQMEKIAKKAADWWIEKTIGSPSFNNGDDSEAGLITKAFVASRNDKVIENATSQQIQQFKTNLENMVKKGLLISPIRFDIDVDYEADARLYDTKKGADLEDIRFPWKTHMTVSINAIHVKLGGGKWDTIHEEEQKPQPKAPTPR